MTSRIGLRAVFHLLVLSLFVLPGGCRQEPADDANEPGRATASPGKMTVAETVRADPRLETLETALDQANMMDRLSGPGPVTLLAPSDTAFDLLGEATIASLMLPRNESRLMEVLGHHVVDRWFSVEDALGQAPTEGDLVTIGRLPVQVEVTEAGVTLDGHAGISHPDIQCSNGVIHVIDAVLMPSRSPANR
jgi:uncharacterized surface protein with fasciclin (FAS1) repeats